ncbi:GHKL domain-containing protein [Enterococcus sp. BWM-S5]|uniref:GHKL domain-containing protein n=1 Tax=Enterococcus larvae TaxID=2794352 RepID=A0ABS4CIV5_9ENTE|nr:GHKL domain-containing protein [Enterococcus larvae]MBP1046532.1 GHKL domain-containing protein [Enterococcus larvae]
MAYTVVGNLFSFQAVFLFSVYVTVLLVSILIPLKSVLKEVITLKLSLIVYGVLYCFFYICAIFYEQLFPYCMVINGHQLIAVVLFLFSFFNIYIFGKEIKVQFFSVWVVLLASIWLYLSQLMSIYFADWVNQPILLIFSGLMLTFVPIIIAINHFFDVSRLITLSNTIILTVLYVLFFLVNTFWLIISSDYFSEPLRIFISSTYPYRTFLQSLNSTVVIASNDVGWEVVLIILFWGIATIPTVLILLLLIKENRGRKKIYEQEQREKELYSYIGLIESFNDELRKIQHDYRNILTTLGGHIYNEQVDVSELKEHYETIMTSLDIKKFEFVHFSKIRNINNLEIVSILVAKIVKASDSNISLTLEIIEPVYFQSNDIMRLVRILGILLDNAIEAAIECENPEVDIAFIQIDADTTVIHIQNNTVNEQLIRQLLSREKNFSTKGEHRGLGLGIVYELVDASDCLKLDFQQQNEIISFSLFVNCNEGKRW